MDMSKVVAALKQAAKDKKLTKPVVLLGLCGIFLIFLSTVLPSGEKGGGEKDPAAVQEEWSAGEYRQRLEADLCRIVSAVTGEDSPQVMVTLENGGRARYAADQRGDETAHVILEDREGSQQGLELTREEPKVQGAVIVSRQAGDPVIREKLVNAARVALGVPSSRVCVIEGG